MQKTTFIYALCEPGTRTVRYIGKSNNPKKRFKGHLQKSLKTRTPLGDWLRSLLGTPPNMIILSEVSSDSWEEEEVRYIGAARMLGMRLMNATEGGEGVHNPSLETLAKKSAAMLGEKNPNFGKARSAGTRAKISASNLGQTRSPETCENIGAAKRGKNHPNFGKALSAETCEKISASLRGENNYMFGKKHSPESNAKRSASMLGKNRGPKSEGHKLKLSKVNSGKVSPNKGVPMTAGQKIKISATKLGVPWSPERRASFERSKLRDQEIEWALAPYTLE